MTDECKVCGGDVQMNGVGDRWCEECETIHRNGYLQFEDVIAHITDDGNTKLYIGGHILGGRVRQWDIMYSHDVDTVVVGGAEVEFTGVLLDVFGKVRIKDNVIELSHERNHTLRW